MSSTLGDKIMLLLHKQHLLQKDLAERLNITEAALSRYITGSREPKPETLANIATVLNTTTDYLLGVEKDDYDLLRVKTFLARNSAALSDEEKKELIKIILFEE